MVTRRARSRDPIARVALFGALAIAVAFGAFALESVETAARSADAGHAVVVPHDARPNVVVAGSNRPRGSAWFASLYTACAFVALAGFVLAAGRRVGYRRNAARFSIRLRAPPSLHVAR
jgi:hypothetical protein